MPAFGRPAACSLHQRDRQAAEIERRLEPARKAFHLQHDAVGIGQGERRAATGNGDRPPELGIGSLDVLGSIDVLLVT